MVLVTPRSNPVVRYGESSQADALEQEHKEALARIIAMPALMAGGLVLQVVKIGLLIGVGYLGLKMLRGDIK